MKVFISGPMSGKPNYNRAAFFKAEEELEKHGYSVWNPAWLAYPSDTEFTKDDMHIIDFAALRRCDAIYMLKGWKHSKGAQEECEYAIMRGLMIMYEGAHCWGKEPEDEHDVLKRHIKTVEEALAWERWKNRLPVEAINVNQAINDVEADLDNFKDETDGKIDDIYDTLHRHDENIEDCKEEIDLLWNNAFTGLEKRVELFNNARKEDIQELFDDMEDRKKDISEQDRRLDCHHNRLMSLSERVDTLTKKCNEFKESTTSNTDTIRELQEIYDGEIDIINKILHRHDGSIKDNWYELQQVRKDVTDLVNTVCDDNRTINNTLTDLNVRLNAIEKRLDIKPFYAPTEDEKDDD